jgi:hypothetical protein
MLFLQNPVRRKKEGEALRYSIQDAKTDCGILK